MYHVGPTKYYMAYVNLIHVSMLRCIFLFAELQRVIQGVNKFHRTVEEVCSREDYSSSVKIVKSIQKTNMPADLGYSEKK